MAARIRKAKPEDGEAIAEILRSLGWFEHINAEPVAATAARVARHLEMCLRGESHSVNIAEDEHGRVVGYAAVHWLPYLMLAGPEGYLSELFLLEDARGRGAGTALLDAVKAEARQRGCSRLMLVNKRNRESYLREFYGKRCWIERPAAANFILPLA
ncbi:MAG: GNAT family N-acetyltransferase [Terracidiphilus sp.]|jgi:GNAT superfamily N-acetyltransferase